MSGNSQSFLTIERDVLTPSVASKNHLLRHLFNSQSVKDVLLPELKMVTLSTLPQRGRSSILPRVEYPFPPVGIVGAADGKNAALFSCPQLSNHLRLL
jgi:hypothetical protein